MMYSKIKGYGDVRKTLSGMTTGDKIYVVVDEPELNNENEFTELSFIVERTTERSFSVTINGYEEDGDVLIRNRRIAGAVHAVIEYAVQEYYADDKNNIDKHIETTTLWTESYDKSASMI